MKHWRDYSGTPLWNDWRKTENGRERDEWYQREETEVGQSFPTRHSTVLKQRTEIRQKTIEFGNLLIYKISPLYIQFKEHGCAWSALLHFGVNTWKWYGCY